MPLIGGLVIIVTSDDAVRFRAAMTTGLAHAALGGHVRLYCHESSVALLARATRPDDNSEALARIGLPDRLALIAMAQGSGITIIACQTGAAILDLSLDALAAGTEAGGMMALMATLGEDRLVSF